MNNLHFLGYSAIHPQDFLYCFPDNSDTYLLLLIQSPSRILVEGELRSYPSNTAILFAPGQEIYYGANGTTYQNDWIRFSTDEGYVTGFPLCGIPFPVTDPEYCHNLFRLLTWESTSSKGCNDIIVDNLLRSLFLKLREDTNNTFDSPRFTELTKLHKQIINKPQEDWSVPSMAKDLHISPGYLQLIYKQTYGNTCMEDVISSRIRVAKEQLLYTEKTINEIADFCGYKNVEHFCRQFRKQTKMTPGNFRKTARSHYNPSQNTI